MTERKLIKVILYLVLLFIVFNPAIGYMLIGILMSYDIIYINKKDIIDFINSNKILVVFCISMLMSSIHSQLWYISIFLFFFFLIQVYYFRVVQVNFKEKDINTILYLILATGIIVSLYGFYQGIISNDIMPERWVDKSIYNIDFRVYSTFFNPNVLSGFLNLCIIVALVVRESHKDKCLYYSANFSLVVCIGCLFITYSRGGWISLCLAILILSYFNKKYFKYFLLLSITFYTFDTIFGSHRLILKNIKVDSSINHRYSIWLASYKIIKDNLWLGIGPGVIWDFFPKYSNSIKSFVPHAHNFYLQIIANIGIIGFTLLIIFLYNSWKKVKSSIGNKDKVSIINTIAFTFTISLLINGLFDAIIIQPQITIYAWFLHGLIYNFNSARSNENMKKSLSTNE